jgi:hypothetical protein
MPGSSTVQRGNEIFSQLLNLQITPPASIGTGVVTSQTLTVNGVQPGDLLSWNIIATANNLVSIANMYVSAVNTVVIGWTTEGATIASLGVQQVLVEVSRPENASVLPNLGALPTAVF